MKYAMKRSIGAELAGCTSARAGPPGRAPIENSTDEINHEARSEA